MFTFSLQYLKPKLYYCPLNQIYDVMNDVTKNI